MFDFERYLNVIGTVNYKNVKENLITISKYVVDSYFNDKPMFNKKDFKYYYYDDFVFDTNNSEVNYITLYVEINQPKNIKAIQTKKFERRVKDKKVKDLHLTLEEIKNGLFEEYVNCFNENTLLWQEKYSINISTNEIVDDEHVNYMIKIIPCFTYVDSVNGNSGVIYYDNSLSQIEIEYPKISIKNYKEKNKQTKGLFYYYNVVFKNLFLELREEKNITFEIFETLLYNVPNALFADASIKTLAQIINFLRNNSIRDYKTIDGLDNAFTSKYKSFSIIYANHAIKQIAKHVKKLI